MQDDCKVQASRAKRDTPKQASFRVAICPMIGNLQSDPGLFTMLA